MMQAVQFVSTHREAIGVYIVCTVGLMSLPLLNVLHAESSAVIATVAFFVSGWSAVGQFRREEALRTVSGQHTGALLIPLLGLTVSMLWAPNCAYPTGLLFFLLFPVITVGLAVALAYALTGTALPHPRAWLVGIGLLIGLGGPLVDLGVHPQFYTYNHVFGGVLGPIYDEQLAMRPGLFVFRGLTLLWAALAILIGAFLRGHRSWRIRSGVGVLLLSIITVYTFRAPLGLNTTEALTQQRLGGHHHTAHIDLYYDPAALTDAQAALMAQTQERHYEALARRLNLDADERPERVAVYLYPTPDVKAALTGARTTSVAPVWLSTPQIHLLQSRHDAHIRHELAHVFGRPFGLPVVRASWAVGLVEGWAVALEAPTDAPSPHDLVAATGAEDPAAIDAHARAIADRLSPLGFWTGRGAVSYTTMGSFVRFLLDAYGPAPLKAAYATASFHTHYGKPLAALTREWAAFLKQRSHLNASAHAVVTARFSRPSLFETTCPHYVPPAQRRYQTAQRALVAGDTTRALAALRRAVADTPSYIAPQRQRARLWLAHGHTDSLRAHLDTLEAAQTDVGLLLARADASARDGTPNTARRLYARAFQRLPRYALNAQALLVLRDAIAHRPDVLRILTSGAPAATQARRLEQVESPTNATRAWTALRWHAAGHADRALTHWNRWAERAPRAVTDRPVLWVRTLRLAHARWRVQAALDAGRPALARQAAQTAERRFRHYGHTTLAAAMRTLQTVR